MKKSSGFLKLISDWLLQYVACRLPVNLFMKMFAPRLPDEMLPALSLRGVCGRSIAGNPRGTCVAIDGKAATAPHPCTPEPGCKPASSYTHKSSSAYVSGEPNEAGLNAARAPPEDDVTSPDATSSSIRKVWKPPLLDQRRFMLIMQGISLHTFIL